MRLYNDVDIGGWLVQKHEPPTTIHQQPTVTATVLDTLPGC